MDLYNTRNVNKKCFLQGMRNGIPIGLGYLAVSFSLGIAAKNAGLNAVQSFLTSLLCNASAGEYAGFTLIAAGASYIEVAVMMLIVNARYLVRCCSLSLLMNPETMSHHRLLFCFHFRYVLFAIAIARPGYLNPYYSYGAVLAAAPCWALGTALGTIAGNILPLRLVSAFSVALYGMFLAVIIPPARKNKRIAGIIIVCFAASFAAAYLPILSEISEGMRTILLTVIIAAAAAVLFPVNQPEEKRNEP